MDSGMNVHDVVRARLMYTRVVRVPVQIHDTMKHLISVLNLSVPTLLKQRQCILDVTVVIWVGIRYTAKNTGSATKHVKMMLTGKLKIQSEKNRFQNNININ